MNPVSIIPRDTCQACKTNKTRHLLHISFCPEDYEKGKVKMQQLLTELQPGTPITITPLPPPIKYQDSDAVEDATIEMTAHLIINDIREKNGFRRLEYNDKLARIAEDHSYDMAIKKFFSHANLRGEKVGTRAKNIGYRYKLIGENIHKFSTSRFSKMHKEDIIGVILYGFPDDPSGWMYSPGHKANILNQQYSEQGLGIFIVGNTCLTTQVLALPSDDEMRERIQKEQEHGKV
jgi:uncharacterized protein YkwD